MMGNREEIRRDPGTEAGTPLPPGGPRLSTGRRSGRREGQRPRDTQSRSHRDAETWEKGRGGRQTREVSGDPQPRRRRSRGGGESAPAGRSLPAALRGCGARAPSPGPHPPAQPGPPAPHLVEGEELLLELLALRVSALPPEPKLHHLASLCRGRARRRRSRPQDAPHGPAGPEAQAGRQEVRLAAWARACGAEPSRGWAQGASEARLDQWACPCAVRPAPAGQTTGGDWAPTLSRAREGTPAELAPQRGACRDL